MYCLYKLEMWSVDVQMNCSSLSAPEQWLSLYHRLKPEQISIIFINKKKKKKVWKKLKQKKSVERVEKKKKKIIHTDPPPYFCMFVTNNPYYITAH